MAETNEDLIGMPPGTEQKTVIAQVAQAVFSDFPVMFVVVSAEVKYHKPAEFNDELNVSLVATNDGPRARVYAEDLDDTSRDNCGIDSKQVRLEGKVLFQAFSYWPVPLHLY